MFELTPAATRFLLHWGEMGSRWGVNRTVAQLFALLYIAPRPLNAEEIATTLSIARSNVSSSLKDLQAWGIVKMVHVLGDRRDYFEAIKDVWELFRIIMAQRWHLEIEPTVQALEECVAESQRRGAADVETRKRLTNLLEFFRSMESWQQQLSAMSAAEIKRAARLGSKVRKLLRAGS